MGCLGCLQHRYAVAVEPAAYFHLTDCFHPFRPTPLARFAGSSEDRVLTLYKGWRQESHDSCSVSCNDSTPTTNNSTITTQQQTTMKQQQTTTMKQQHNNNETTTNNTTTMKQQQTTTQQQTTAQQQIMTQHNFDQVVPNPPQSFPWLAVLTESNSKLGGAREQG